MFELDSFMGKLTCMFALVSGTRYGALSEALELCTFIFVFQL